jgi:hypothetical protein
MSAFVAALKTAVFGEPGDYTEVLGRDVGAIKADIERLEQVIVDQRLVNAEAQRRRAVLADARGPLLLSRALGQHVDHELAVNAADDTAAMGVIRDTQSTLQQADRQLDRLRQELKDAERRELEHQIEELTEQHRQLGHRRDGLGQEVIAATREWLDVGSKLWHLRKLIDPTASQRDLVGLFVDALSAEVFAEIPPGLAHPTSIDVSYTGAMRRQTFEACTPQVMQRPDDDMAEQPEVVAEEV